MDSTQNFNYYPTQNFNPLFFMNTNSYVNQNNNNFNQINPMNQMNNNINYNMNNFNQMNHMNNNNINFNNNYNNNNNFILNNSKNNNYKIIDLFHYIKEEKKIIKFINSDYKSFSIKIPISINKSDLYSIAYKYKSNSSLKIILSYKNIMIKEDESSIEEIPEGAEINIIEERPIPNTCYYDKLIKKYGNDDMRNLVFLETSGKKKVLSFPGKVTLSDAKISFFNIYGLNDGTSNILFDAEKLENNDERKIKDITACNLSLTVIKSMETLSYGKVFGKAIIGKVTVKNKEQEKGNTTNFIIEIGTLDPTSKLYENIETTLCLGKKIKKLYLNNKEISRYEQSMLSLGIKEDFNVLAEI